MGLNLSLLPILGKLLVGHQPALDHALLPGGAAANVRAAIGGATLAREARLLCGQTRRSTRSARRAGLGEGGQCGMRRSWGSKRGGMIQGGGEVYSCRPDRRGPPPPPVVRVGDVRFSLLLPDCARRMRKKMQPCAWRHVAKVGPMDPGSCMRRYISVLRLTRPQ